MRSLIGQNMTEYVHNISFAFVTQLYFHFFDFFCFLNFFFNFILWANLASFFFTNLRLQLQNSFFLNFNYCFLFLVWYCLTTCVNRVANCVMQKFTPWGPNFTKKYFRCHFMDNLGNYSTYLSPHYKNSFFLNLNFFSCSRPHGV